jgi:hypothetical protein
MKNLIFSIITFILIINQVLFTQNYFDPNNFRDVDLNSPPNSTGAIYFGLEGINTDFLDIAVTQADRIGQWNPNYGNGSFGTYSTFFNNPTTGSLQGDLFVKLRPGSFLKDFIVGRYDGLQVHLNEYGAISGIVQNIINESFPWMTFESGEFYSARVEDIIISNASHNIQVCRNLLSSASPYISNPVAVDAYHPVYIFKLRQLNEKAKGYVQNNPNDRSDILFVDQSGRDQRVDDHIYVYLNNNSDEDPGFNTTPFASFNADHPEIVDLELSDIDNDGYNDLIIISENSSCPTDFYAEVYRNIQGAFIDDNTIMWSTYLGFIGCESIYKICVSDLNKDGMNDLVFLTNENQALLRVKVFINQNTSPIFTQNPQQDVVINLVNFPFVTNAITADIYGGQMHDGGGFALLLSYYFNISGESNEYYVKVLNGVNQKTNPPPPIVQGFLEYDHDNIWHPHIHLNCRGERDFIRYNIYKWKTGDPRPNYYDNTTDTGWTDIYECVDATGQQSPWWNCYYYATEIDFAYKESIPSQLALYRVGCEEPLCYGCYSNRMIMNINEPTSHTPSNFSLSNYPNPFNPTTKITFSLPSPCYVKITIYNLAGQVVRELTNGYYEAGSFSIQFDGTNLATGIYFCRIETKRFTQTKNILLIK